MFYSCFEGNIYFVHITVWSFILAVYNPNIASLLDAGIPSKLAVSTVLSLLSEPIPTPKEGAIDGDIIAEYKGTYSYKHPNLVLTITRVGIEMEHQAKMNDVKSEFSYPISDGKLVFKKK